MVITEPGWLRARNAIGRVGRVPADYVGEVRDLHWEKNEMCTVWGKWVEVREGRRREKDSHLRYTGRERGGRWVINRPSLGHSICYSIQLTGFRFDGQSTSFLWFHMLYFSLNTNLFLREFHCVKWWIEQMSIWIQWIHGRKLLKRLSIVIFTCLSMLLFLSFLLLFDYIRSAIISVLGTRFL